jgi:hypothetical protein
MLRTELLILSLTITLGACLASEDTVGPDQLDGNADGKADGTRVVHWDVPTLSTAEVVIGGAHGGASAPSASVAAAAEIVVTRTLPAGPADHNFGWMVGTGGEQYSGTLHHCNTDQYNWRKPDSADNNLSWPDPTGGPLVVTMTNSGLYPVNLLLLQSTATSTWASPSAGLIQPIRIKAGVHHGHTRVFANNFGLPLEEDFLVLAAGETLAMQVPAVSSTDAYFTGWTSEPNGRAYGPALEVACKGDNEGLHFVYAARQHIAYAIQ